MATLVVSLSYGVSAAPLTSSRRTPTVVKCTKAPNVAELCEKARISLSLEEAEQIGPQISKVVDWFAQLQDVDVENIEPAVRAGDTGNTFRKDEPSPFSEREAMLESVPDMEGPFIKVPKILSESVE